MQTKNLKTKPIHTRINEIEKNRFKDIANKNGLKTSSLIRKLIREVINKKIELVPDEMKEFKSAIRQLVGISRNLNQLTRAVNSGKIPGNINNVKYWSDIKKHVSGVQEELESYIRISETRWVNKEWD